MDAGVKLRPSAEELKDFGPEFEQRWKEYFADKPDKPVIFMCPLTMCVPVEKSPIWQLVWLSYIIRFIGDPTSVPPRKYFCMGYFPGYPKATGHVHIKSADDLSAPLDFETAYCKA